MIKIQRYIAHEYNFLMSYTTEDDGDLCLSKDVEKLEAEYLKIKKENEKLREERDRYKDIFDTEQDCKVAFKE